MVWGGSWAGACVRSRGVKVGLLAVERAWEEGHPPGRAASIFCRASVVRPACAPVLAPFPHSPHTPPAHTHTRTLPPGADLQRVPRHLARHQEPPARRRPAVQEPDRRQQRGWGPPPRGPAHRLHARAWLLGTLRPLRRTCLAPVCRMQLTQTLSTAFTLQPVSSNNAAPHPLQPRAARPSASSRPTPPPRSSCSPTGLEGRASR